MQRNSWIKVLFKIDLHFVLIVTGGKENLTSLPYLDYGLNMVLL